MSTHSDSKNTSIGTTNEFVSTYEAALILGRAPHTVRLFARHGRLVISPSVWAFSITAIITRAGRLYRRCDVEKLAEHLQRRTIGGSEQCRG
jgi:hypothetical protein